MTNALINRATVRQLPRPTFLDWVVSEDIVSINGTPLKCFCINGAINDDVLDNWALHIRRHYIRDDELARNLAYRNLDSESYLRDWKIPDAAQIRSGDFGEIVISDLLQFIEGYEVPRYKQHGRHDKNNSEHGTDVIAYKVSDLNKPSKNDELVAVEVKSRASSSDLIGAIAAADKDSPKDKSRVGMTLEYFAERSLDAGDTKTSEELKRFLHAGEHPFKQEFSIGAVVGVDNVKKSLLETKETEIVISNANRVFVVHRAQLMELIHEIYERCVS